VCICILCGGVAVLGVKKKKKKGKQLPRQPHMEVGFLNLCVFSCNRRIFLFPSVSFLKINVDLVL